MKIFLIVLLFYIVFISCIEIKSFDTISCPSETTTEFTYQFSEYSRPEGRDVYFYFNFNFTYISDLEFKIINENNSVTPFTIDRWRGYNISNLKSQKFTFQLNNKGKYSGKIVFIDSTKEININLDEFLNLKFAISSVVRPPLPLIFNIGTIQEEIYYNYKRTNYGYSDYIYEGDYLMNYCIIEGKECEFEGFNLLKLEKGKKYKIKYLFYVNNDSKKYYFPPITSYLYNNIKEFDNCIEQYESDGTEKIHYYFINTKGYKKIFIYAKYGDVSYSSIENRNKLVIYGSNFKGIKTESEESINVLYDTILLKVVDKIDSYYLNYFYIVQSYFSVSSNLQSISLDLNKGECAFIEKERTALYSKYIILSSVANIGVINRNSYSPPEKYSNIALFKDYNINNEVHFFLIDSSKEKSNVIGYVYKEVDKSDPIGYYYSTLYFNIMTNDNIYDTFNQYNTDCMFKRFNTYSSDFGFKTTYFFGLEEDYYLYIKKHYGNSALYCYTQQLNSLTNVTQFQKPYFSYENSNYYQPINNELLTISKYQLFTFIMNYNSLYDVFIQKVNDYEVVKLNSDIFPFNNLVKLLKENKYYKIDFALDHLIKLDNNFLDAEVTFTSEEGKISKLNKNKKILVLTGNNYKVISSNGNALLYFYYRIPNYSNKGRVIFDKTQKRKNLKFNVEKVGGLLVKDFCFEGFYPILNNQTWQKINKNDVYIDNIIDNLEYDLYENEEYIIYIFDSFDENNFPIFGDNEISNIQYVDNLLSERNKYNFEVVPGKTNGNIILNSVNKTSIYYQFITCKNERIKFKYENSSGQDEITFQNESAYFSINNDEILINSFESENEFLFIYTFQNSREPSTLNIKDFEPSIVSLEEVSRNVIRIIFNADSNLRKYYIVIAKKDEYNNVETFSNPCYVAKLMTNNSNLITVKTIYESTNNPVIITDINIANLNITENEELVVIIINQILIPDKQYKFGAPKEFKLVLREAIETFPEQNFYVDYSTNNNYFKFHYNHETDIDQLAIFRSSNSVKFFFVFNEINQIDYTVNTISKELPISLNKSGTFYFYLYPITKTNDTELKYYITGKTIDTIDLTDRLYTKKSTDKYNIKPNPEIYIVNNLKKDTYVFFISTILDQTFKTGSPFVICNDKNECSNNVITYNFLKGMNYKIYINFIEYSYYQEINYYYPSFYFFPIFEDTIEVKETGYYFISVPKIFIINIENKKEITAMLKDGEIMYSTGTNNTSLEYLNQKEYTNLTLIHTISNKKKYNYGVVAAIPYFNENPTKLIIVDHYLTRSGDYSFLANSNGILDFWGDNSYPKEGSGIDFYNDLIFFNSPVKNMKIIDTLEHPETDFIVLNKIAYPIYVDKFEKDISIIMKTYYGKFAVFGVLSDSSYNEVLYNLSDIEGLSKIKNIESRKSLNLKINTNLNGNNDYFNFFIYDFSKKINVYFKKIYGNAEIYEDETNYIDLKNFSALSKPMKTFEGKKSLFNSIYTLNNNKSIVGHLNLDSLFYSYVEIDNDTDTIINRNPYNPNSLLNDFNVAKYLKKGILYSFNFTVDHLFKLEPGFNAEVTIYDDKKKLILNPNKRTGEFNGNNVKIISNNNAMIYLYGRLWRYYNYEFEIENHPGTNIEIEMTYEALCFIDFAFKGFEPHNVMDTSNFRDKYIYIENIYDKLEAYLVEGEKLYLLTLEGNIVKNIKYTENLRHKNNKYNFAVIPSNAQNKTLIINKGKKDIIRYQVNFCKSPHNIKMYYQESQQDKESLLEFNEKTTIIGNYHIETYGSIKLRFESDNDFIFSYSFKEMADVLISSIGRKIGKNFTINIVKKYPNDAYSNDFTINFQPNYYNSSTKYIIVIVNSKEDNSLESMSNPCYISKLATERNESAKIVEIVDSGENDTISVDVDISDLLGPIDEYIVNIISLELRFEKKLNFYIPCLFNHSGIKPIDIELSQKQEFTTPQIFNLPYIKQSENREVFLLHYHLEEESKININVEDPTGHKKSFITDKKDGYISFSCDKGGSYKLIFYSNSLYKKLNNEDEEIRGTFDIISTEYPLEINIKEKYFDFDEINVEGVEIDSLKFNIKPLDQDYVKKITIENKNFFEIKDFVSIMKDDEEFQNLNFSYYLFEKNVNYQLQIKFNKNNDNNFIFEKFNIKDYSLNNIQDFSVGEHLYNDIEDKFLIINWTNYKNIEIISKNDNNKFFKSKINENQIKNLVKEFQNIKFEKLGNLLISKPSDISYEILMIELKENNTLIRFLEKDEKESGNKNNKGNAFIYIIIASVTILVILIVIFLIVRHFRREKATIEYVNTIKEEKLMSDI